ncbi:MAG TPA: fructose-bisphosphate aldolase class I [Dehalococcoidia bacterium]|nr:fructose-bisphosphate aldolase class I [Dehalococcoidia bacterium]
MNREELESCAGTLVAPGKGILAADESSSTIKRHLASIDVESTEGNRRIYRELLFSTPGIEKYISGVILFDETIRQNSGDGTPFTGILDGKGIIPGIKVDKGTVDLPGFPGEKVTEGLDGLRERLVEYRDLGARFTKWRAVITIDEGIPTRTCISTNARLLALFAAFSQEAGLVPIVEPEVLSDGDHTIERCEEVTSTTLEQVFSRLREHQVSLEGMLLKPNMVLSGKACPEQAGITEVAEATVRCLLRTVPSSVPGIVFLSGGQSPQLATEHLNAMNLVVDNPWELSFSYGRALQYPVLRAWKGRQENVAGAQHDFHLRAMFNSAARNGTYSIDMEQAAS